MCSSASTTQVKGGNHHKKKQFQFVYVVLSLRPIWSGRPPRALALLAVGGGWIWISVSPHPAQSTHTPTQSKKRGGLSSKKECAFRSNYLKFDYVYNTNPQMCSKKGCLDRAHWYYTRRTYVTVCSLFGKLAVVSSRQPRLVRSCRLGN